MELVAMAIVGVLALVFLAECWVLSQARRQQLQVSSRLDDLSIRLARTPANDEHRVIAIGRSETVAPPGVPAFTLPLLGGGEKSLAELLRPANPVMLIFTHPRCGPCFELLPDIGGWQRQYGARLTVALISSGDASTNLAMTDEYGIRDLMLQHESELFDRFNLEQLPAVVLLDAEGRITGEPGYGVPTIRRLVADTLGLALPETPVSVPTKTLQRGEAVPALRRPDLNGNIFDFTTLKGAPTLVLFWSPGCTHCQDVLDEIKQFEQQRNRTRLLIVSRGPVGLNQEVGFKSPVLLDDDHAISKLFGSTGTPAAILIDSHGSVATTLARGSNGVRAALNASVVSRDPGQRATDRASRPSELAVQMR